MTQFGGFGRADLLASFALFDDKPQEINEIEEEFPQGHAEVHSGNSKGISAQNKPHGRHRQPRKIGQSGKIGGKLMK